MESDISGITNCCNVYIVNQNDNYWRKIYGRNKTYSWKQLLMVSSLIFGMFFGSGNLIFPVHLGQMAGANWVSAGVGFAISGALFPLLAILAVVVTKSDGLYDLAKPVGKWYAALFLILVHLTIGPFFGTPRTAATAFEMAAKPFCLKI